MSEQTITLQDLRTEAAELIISKMHKGQAFSIKTIDSWTQADYLGRVGSRGTYLLVRTAVADLVEAGRIVRRDGKYAPGITEGYVLA